MGKLSCHVRRWRVGFAAALFGAVLIVPLAARADDDGLHGEHLTCPGRETLVRIDESDCPPNNNRDLIVRKRACCENPAGRVHCFPFAHCPSKSPS